MRFAGQDRIGVENGEITVAFRRWSQPRVVAGRDYRTNGGRLRIDSVDRIAPSRITASDARAAGRPNAAAVRADDRGDRAGPLYRIRFHLITEPDARELLAADDRLSADDLAGIARRLERYDKAGSHGAWTEATLRLIAANPARRAPDLAAEAGRETQPFKIDVRKLKNLGLTYSLAVGYRLSPRGTAYLRWLDTRQTRRARGGTRTLTPEGTGT
jgi:hypothetical protein